MESFEDEFIIDNKLFDANKLINYHNIELNNIQIGQLYLVTCIQGDKQYGNLILLESRDEPCDIINEKNEIIYKAYYGYCYSPAYGTYGEYGVYDNDIIGNYTQYLIRRNAVTRIQYFWRRYKSAIIIKQAWKNWKNKMNLANPSTFSGCVYNIIQFIRLKNID